MRELLTEIAEHLANNGGGIYGTGDPDARTIFTGEMPDTVTKGILIVNVPGGPPHNYVDTEQHILDFWAKAPKSDEARALLRIVYNLYSRNYDITLTNWHVYFSNALGPMVDANRNREGGKLYRLSIQFMCRNLNNVS